MSIFGSTVGPALIHIPRFSSPERATTAEHEDGPVRESTSVLGANRPPKAALTRDQERQSRFKNTNTKWESLGRMIEQQKASGTSSLLHFLGREVDIAAALGGKGKEPLEPRPDDTRNTRSNAPRKTTRGEPRVAKEREVQDETRRNSQKPGSPTKRKREQNLEDRVQVENRSGKRVAGRGTSTRACDELVRSGGNAGKQQEEPSKASRKQRAQPLSPVSPSVSGDLATVTTPGSSLATTEKPKGRVPRAALRKAPPPSNPASLETQAPARRSPNGPKPAVKDSASESVASMKPSNPAEPLEIPRALARRPPSPSPNLNLTPGSGGADEIDLESQGVETNIATSARHVGAQPRGQGNSDTVRDRRVTSDKKDRGASRDDAGPADDQRKDPIDSRAKARRVAKSGAADHEERERAAPVTVRKGVTKASTNERERQETASEAKRTRFGPDVVQAASRISSRVKTKVSGSPTFEPSEIHGEPPKKRTKKQIARRPTSSPPPLPSATAPAPSTRLLEIPPLLPLPASDTSKGPAAKTKQLQVHSERLGSALSPHDGKPNAFDVLVAMLKTTASERLERLDMDDPEDSARARALQSFVAALRISLLYRSADVSEQSALQRRLTASRAKSKELKAHLEELREDRGKKRQREQ